MDTASIYSALRKGSHSHSINLYFSGSGDKLSDAQYGQAGGALKQPIPVRTWRKMGTARGCQVQTKNNVTPSHKLPRLEVRLRIPNSGSAAIAACSAQSVLRQLPCAGESQTPRSHVIRTLP